ncbi:hypothetical protein ACFQU2_32150 [Siccirubricoccus deserti]
MPPAKSRHFADHAATIIHAWVPSSRGAMLVASGLRPKSQCSDVRKCRNHPRAQTKHLRDTRDHRLRRRSGSRSLAALIVP